jgi:hypothetical protein
MLDLEVTPLTDDEFIRWCIDLREYVCSCHFEPLVDSSPYKRCSRSNLERCNRAQVVKFGEMSSTEMRVFIEMQVAKSLKRALC